MLVCSFLPSYLTPLFPYIIATSALDSDSEKVVQNALDAASDGRLVVSIAHRLSSIQHYDLIAVVSSGTIIEQGTHQELLALNKVYATMVKAQQLSALQ